MHPATQTQTDPSLTVGIACDPDTDQTRQEFKDDSDVNKLLARFGAIPHTGETPVFGEYDFDLDLQTAHEHIQQAAEAHNALPASLRAAYPSWMALAAAMASGEVTVKAAPVKKTEPQKAAASPEVPSGGDGASPAAASTNPTA